MYVLFLWNFKGAIWNVTQHFEPMHHKKTLKFTSCHTVDELWHLNYDVWSLSETSSRVQQFALEWWPAIHTHAPNTHTQRTQILTFLFNERLFHSNETIHIKQNNKLNRFYQRTQYACYKTDILLYAHWSPLQWISCLMLNHWKWNECGDRLSNVCNIAPYSHYANATSPFVSKF